MCEYIYVSAMDPHITIQTYIYISTFTHIERHILYTFAKKNYRLKEKKTEGVALLEFHIRYF